MSTLTYDRIKDSFVRQLESLGLVSLDSSRHKQLSEAVDSLADCIRKFVNEEQPEVAEALPKADPLASADDVAAWLPEITLPQGWKFWQVPSAAHGAGRAVFAVYDPVTQSPVTGRAHIKLQAPDGVLIGITVKPDDGKDALVELVNFTISEYGKPSGEELAASQSGPGDPVAENSAATESEAK